MLPERQHQQLVTAFRDRFLEGERFETISAARSLGGEIIGDRIRAGTPEAKELEECIEQGLVRAARAIADEDRDADRPALETYDRLVDLYERQPTLGTRSSTSMQRQQYSTPMPVAFLASRMAGIEPGDRLYEPTAGHGALLLEANPTQVTVNELDDDRALDLLRQGYQVTQEEATTHQPDGRADVVIANPPFGRRKGEDNRAERWQIGAEDTPVRTSQIDHAIAWKALENLNDDGRAVLILGSERGDTRSRSDQYNNTMNRGFFYNLYNNYRVTRHVTVDGSLYQRQGAGFPVDVIQIEGRGRSPLRLPAADVPPVYRSYDELKGLLTDVERERTNRSPGVDAGIGVRPGAADGDILRRAASPELGADRGRTGLPIPSGEPPAADGPVLDGGPASDAGGDAGDGEPDSGPRADGNSREAGDEPQRVGESGGELAADDAGDRELAVSPGTRDGPGGEPGNRADDSRTDLGGMAPPANDAAVTTTRPMAPTDNNQQQQSGQVQYVPRSRGPQLDTLIPRNMADAAQDALDRLETEVGDIDEYVAGRLNFGSVGEMHDSLAAEQVDGIALSFRAMEQGQAALIGDQTGVGKGRQLAATLKYAKDTGRTPVFVTRDPALYADMARDLDDIGESGFRPFMTNNNETVPLGDGRELKTRPETHANELNEMREAGGLSDAYDGVFTTYSQLQTVKGKETPRRDFLRQIAPNAILVFDESHEAGGSPAGERSANEPPNRAEFARQLVDSAQGVVFASATAAKRPDVLDLYGRKTDMGAALGTVGALQSALETGGIPLQQAATTMLVEDGAYTRREKSYEGVEFQIQTVSADRESTDGMADIMRSIMLFDREKQKSIGELDEDLKAQAKSLSEDNSVGSSGAESINFTALMHNVVSQSLVARKADDLADEAIESMQRGEKPVIAVSNTMGSFIEEYAKAEGLDPGDEIDVSFNDVLSKYLWRSRDVIEKGYDGEGERRQLTDAELGPEGVEAFERAQELIDSTELNFPVSPIDRIKQRVEAAGYSFGEITGRKDRLEYDADGNATYQRRGSGETSKAAKVDTVGKFNSGKTDVLLLNRSGATGISLHASEKFENQDQRHLIVGQPEANVNEFMQTLGRVNRTGQVVKPKISLFMGDTPDEKRPAAVLEKKLASLNANTTAAREGGFDTSSIPDFFNEFGDSVVTNLLAEYPDINERLDFPIAASADSDYVPENAIGKVTGRLPLLSVAEQEEFYTLLEGEYNEFVEQQKSLGNNILEAQTVDLDARTLASAEVIPPKEGIDSAFAGGVVAEVVDVKAQKQPKTQLEVVNELREKYGQEPVESLEDFDRDAIAEDGMAQTRDLLRKAAQAGSVYQNQQEGKIRAETQDPEKQQGRIDKLDAHLKKQEQTLSQLNRFSLGQTVRMQAANGVTRYGTITGIAKRGETLDDTIARDGTDDSAFGSANPLAPSKWRINISTADSSRELSVPLSKVNNDRAGNVTLAPAKVSTAKEDIWGLFDERQTGQREIRQVMRGNLLVAADKFGTRDGGKGEIVNATTSDGSQEPMVLMPQGYDIEKELADAPVKLPAARNVRQFFELTDNQGIVKDAKERVAIGQSGDEATIFTGKKEKGITLDSDLLEAMGTEFYSVGGEMRATFDADRLDDVVGYLQSGKKLTMEAVNYQDVARELVGSDLPSFEWSDTVEDVRERAGLPPEVDTSDLEAARERLDGLFAQEAEADEVGADASQEPTAAAAAIAPESEDAIASETEDAPEIEAEAETDVPAAEAEGEAIASEPSEPEAEAEEPEAEGEAIAPESSETEAASAPASRPEKLEPLLVGTEYLSSDVPREAFDPEQVERVAESFLEAGNALSPIPVERDAASEDAYEPEFKVADRHLEYWGAVRAQEIEPRRAEHASTVEIDATTRDAALGQLAELSGQAVGARSGIGESVEPDAGDGE